MTNVEQEIDKLLMETEAKLQILQNQSSEETMANREVSEVTQQLNSLSEIMSRMQKQPSIFRAELKEAAATQDRLYNRLVELKAVRDPKKRQASNVFQVINGHITQNGEIIT